jgi:hypothetical protein
MVNWNYGDMESRAKSSITINSEIVYSGEQRQ